MTDGPVTNSDLQIALAPMQKSIERIEGDLRNLEDRIVQLPNIYLTRADYKDRHDDVAAAVRALQIDATQSKQWANDQHAAIKAEFLREIQGVRAEMKASNDANAGNRSASTKWVITLLCTPLIYFAIELALHALHFL